MFHRKSLLKTIIMRFSFFSTYYITLSIFFMGYRLSKLLLHTIQSTTQNFLIATFFIFNFTNTAGRLLEQE